MANAPPQTIRLPTINSHCRAPNQKRGDYGEEGNGG